MRKNKLYKVCIEIETNLDEPEEVKIMVEKLLYDLFFPEVYPFKFKISKLKVERIEQKIDRWFKK